jgi:signal transduction histidine kinase
VAAIPGSWPKRILHRIVVPFVVLFAGITVFFWFVSAYFITRFLDQNLQKQIEQVVSIISKSGFALNRGVLLQLKEVTGADIIVFDSGGQVLRSTFPSDRVEREARGYLPAAADFGEALLTKDTSLQNVEYRTAFHTVTLPSQDQVLLSLWVPSQESEYLKERIVAGMGIAGLLGIVILAAAGYGVARTITAPVQELVRTTEAVAGGDLRARARVFSRDEIGLLAGSFNEMIGRLSDYEQMIVESERLAAAGQVAAGLAHEIRNPLTSIRMFGEVLHNRLAGEEQNRKMLGSMIQEIDRIDRIVEEMLNRARPGELRLEPDNLNSQVEAVAALAAESLSSRNVSVSLRLSPDIPPVEMDRARIRQVLWNLLLNAADAMPGGGTVTITTRVAGGGLVEAAVEDLGAGLAAGIEPEGFFRPLCTTKPEGMGMGLTISRKIAEQHGGSLRLENRTEGGARATMLLPVKSAQSGDPEENG